MATGQRGQVGKLAGSFVDLNIKWVAFTPWGETKIRQAKVVKGVVIVHVEQVHPAPSLCNGFWPQFTCIVLQQTDIHKMGM